MPAVIGVVFVFLIAVIVWVIASSVGDDGGAGGPIATPAPTAAPPAVTDDPSSVTSVVSVTGTTSPAPMPATTAPTSAPPSSAVESTASSTTNAATTTPPTTTPPTTQPPPVTAAPATTAPGSDPDTVPGDLGVAGRPMQRPGCDGTVITVLASAIGDQATAESIAAVLDRYPGSNYLRTDETCSSLNAASGGEPIYVVYLGPFASATDACAARADGPDGAYARRLSNDVPPDHVVDCS